MFTLFLLQGPFVTTEVERSNVKKLSHEVRPLDTAETARVENENSSFQAIRPIDRGRL
jgi:hypothetical protein